MRIQYIFLVFAIGWGILFTIFVLPRVHTGAPDLLPSFMLENQMHVSHWSKETQEVSARHLNSPPSMKVIVLTMDRFQSLQRLLSSLQGSDYLNDRVDLEIKFDLPPVVTSTWQGQFQHLKSTFEWKYGNVTFTVAHKNQGLRQAWLAAWTPLHAAERAIILEDDVEVSELWYKWLKGAHDQYRTSKDLAGFSLQRQTLVPLKTERANQIDSNSGKPFLYKLVGSIGYSPIASKWLDFLDFAECALTTNLSVATPELITSDWYNRGRHHIWTQLFIFFCKHYSLYTMYVFPNNSKALASHWREKGAHSPKTLGPDFRLVSAPSMDWEMLFPSDVPRYGWNGKVESKSPEQRLLVMSAALGYSEVQYEATLSNLRKHFDGDVSLLIFQNTSTRIHDILSKYRVNFATTSLKPSKERYTDSWRRINQIRWQFYKNACSDDHYDLCATFDFRDTLFQDNPFRGMEERQYDSILHVYKHNLVMNDWHLDWANECHGNTTFLQKQKIINAGGLISSPSNFKALSQWIAHDAEACDDQVALNIAVYEGRLNTTIVHHQQGTGSINNIAWGGVFRKDSRGRFLSNNCLLSPMVHQYDKIS